MNELIVSHEQIESRIFTFRGVQVMTDRDLAELYQVETRALNQAVKRNMERFPETFRFQLSESEFENWKSQIVMSKEDKMGLRRPPYVFTEQGVAMLSAVLRSEIAVKISVQIMNAFIAMRKIIQDNQLVFKRLDALEQKQLTTDSKMEQVLKALESKDALPTQGVFFNGQIFDAYELASKIIRSAKKEIILIDNYIDENTLTHLAKKNKNTKILLLTKSISKTLALDIKKANEQYGHFEVKLLTQSHDRFLIIDQKEIYHLGASLKDLGRKWFAFSKMETSIKEMILTQINKELAI
jgi:hypothetical protein